VVRANTKPPSLNALVALQENNTTVLQGKMSPSVKIALSANSLHLQELLRVQTANLENISMEKVKFRAATARSESTNPWNSRKLATFVLPVNSVLQKMEFFYRDVKTVDPINCQQRVQPLVKIVTAMLRQPQHLQHVQFVLLGFSGTIRIFFVLDVLLRRTRSSKALPSVNLVRVPVFSTILLRHVLS